MEGNEERIMCKRPLSEKDLTFCLNYEAESEKSAQKEKDEWDFSHLHDFYNKAVHQGCDFSQDMIDSLKTTIVFLQKLKNEVNRRHKVFSESHENKPSGYSRTQNYARIFLKASPSVSSGVGSFGNRLAKKSRNSPMISDIPRQLSSNTIWNMTQKFLTIVPTISVFSPYLSQANPDITIPELGPHYSIRYNEFLRNRFRDTVFLRVSRMPVSSTAAVESSPSIVFHRLLSSFVPLSKEIVIDREENPSEIKQIKHNDDEIFPSDTCGTSPYSTVPFDDKLLLEIGSIQLLPNNANPSQMNNEIMLELIRKREKFIKVVNETNRLREYINDRVKNKENFLMERYKNTKKWQDLMEKNEALKKTIGRPKSRGKYN